jgi:hypothetical protein
METHTYEARIILAIEAIRMSKKLSCWGAAKIYNIPYTTLSNRMVPIRNSRGKAYWKAIGASLRITLAKTKDAF